MRWSICYVRGVTEDRHGSDALEKLRREMDALDEQIVERLRRRAGVSAQVGQVKPDDGRSVYAPAREAELLDRLTRLRTGALRPEDLRAIYREILSASRDLQRPLRIAFLGPKATYGHQAALQRFGAAAQYVPVATNPAIVDEVERGGADFGVIPIENSTAGPVGESQDRLVDTDLQICDEITILVAHCLHARCTLDEIETVYAHVQAAEQCARWLAQNVPGCRVVHVASNGLAAEPRLAGKECGRHRAARGQPGLRARHPGERHSGRLAELHALLGHRSADERASDRSRQDRGRLQHQGSRGGVTSPARRGRGSSPESPAPLRAAPIASAPRSRLMCRANK